ncbi:MAG: SLC13 family permease [Thermoplasmata archaeon]
MENVTLIALVIFVLTYFLISVRRLSSVPIEKPAAALLGAALMVIFSIVTPEDALDAIDLHTIALLLGMMIMVAVLDLCGFFAYVSVQIVRRAKTQTQFLVLLMVATAVLSALILNDTVVLLFTPIIIRSCAMMKVDPVPYLISEAISANVGSVATEIGNPQNAYIAMASGISFIEFSFRLIPVTAVCLLISIAIVYAIFKEELSKPLSIPEPTTISKDLELFSFGKMKENNEQVGDKASKGMNGIWNMIHSMRLEEIGKIRVKGIPYIALFTLGCVFIGFCIGPYVGMPISMIAVLGGVVLLFVTPIFSNIKPNKVLQSVDWTVLLFFVGLFVVLRGVAESGLLALFQEFFDNVSGGRAGEMAWLYVICSVLSNLISNVPAVMLLAGSVPMTESAWLALAASSTLAGNATILGAAANIIVAESASKMGVEVGFWKFMKIGMPVTIATLAASYFMLELMF